MKVIRSDQFQASHEMVQMSSAKSSFGPSAPKSLWPVHPEVSSCSNTHVEIYHLFNYTCLNSAWHNKDLSLFCIHFDYIMTCFTFQQQYQLSLIIFQPYGFYVLPVGERKTVSYS